MNWSDDTLMAYADDELEPAARAELEGAMASDVHLRERVAVLQSQRDRVRAAYAPVLDEPMPDRLSALLAAPAPAPTVVSLDAARAARNAPRPASRSGLSWTQWGGMAASVVLGVLVGMNLPRGSADGPPVAMQDGRLVAGPAVAQALNTQLASEPVAGAVVAVQISFIDKDGNVCRTFSNGAMAALACRQGDAWAVQTVVAAERPASGAMRQAASALPRALLDAVDARIDGAALDAGGEKQARERGWRR